jgi:flavin-dependent dehydrogenase
VTSWRGRHPTLVALVAALPAGAVRGLGHRLLVDRTAEGWWYALADADRTTIAYCLPADRIGRGAAVWRAACAAADWVPDTAGQVRPRARFRPVGRGPTAADPTIRLVGDAALSVDWLSGRGLALALESGLDGSATRYDEVAESHERQRRDVYRRMYHPEN